MLHPIGSLLFIDNAEFDPNVEFEGSVWEQVAQDKCVQGASDTHTTGTILNAGLPNITGTYNVDELTNDHAPLVTGAFNYTWVGGSEPQAGNGRGSYGIDFDASRSNPIYGNSTTVQPPALCVNIWKRIA